MGGMEGMGEGTMMVEVGMMGEGGIFRCVVYVGGGDGDGGCGCGVVVVG